MRQRLGTTKPQKLIDANTESIRGWTGWGTENRFGAMELESGVPKYYIHNPAQMPERRRKTTLVGRIVAIPTLLLGVLMLIDVFILPSQHETETVAGKYVTHGRHNSNNYCLRLTGVHIYDRQVAYWFYSRCGMGDTVELSVTPLFRTWHDATLMRNGNADGQVTPIVTFLVEFLGFSAWIPMLLWNRRFCDYMNDALDENPKAIFINLVIYVFVAVEGVAVFFWGRFACVCMGWFDSM